MLDHPTPYDWIRLTHVCRSWRQLALSTTSLWTHIAITGGPNTWGPTDELLRRAGDQLLTVTCSTYRARNIQRVRYVFNKCRDQISRAIFPTTIHLITPTYAQNAAHLETLIFFGPEVGMVPLDYEIEYWNADVDGPFPFQALKHLRTTSYLPGPICCLFASTLTSLVLRCPRERDDASEDAPWSYESDQLAAALLHTPLLEILSIDVYELMEAVTFTPALPNLRQLNIRGSLTPCIALYLALRIPRNTCLELDCQPCYNAPLEEAPQAIAAAATNQSLIDSSRFEPVVAFSIDGSGSCYELRGWRSSSIVVDDLNIQPPDVRVKIPAWCDRDDVRVLMSAIPLPGPRLFHLEVYPWVQANWTASETALALAALPSLQTVFLQMAPPHALCRIAAATPARELQIQDVEFSRGAHDDRKCAERKGVRSFVLQTPTLTAAVDFGVDGTVQSFVDACAGRSSRLEWLSLAKMRRFGEADAARLRGVVGELVWDGHEDMGADDTDR